MPSLVSVMPRLERSKMVTRFRARCRAATDRLDWTTYSVCRRRDGAVVRDGDEVAKLLQGHGKLLWRV